LFRMAMPEAARALRCKSSLHTHADAAVGFSQGRVHRHRTPYNLRVVSSYSLLTVKIKMYEYIHAF
jgi:hypothetical protein